MKLFGIGYLLGRLSNIKPTGSVNKINDKVKYSCLWWGKEAKREDLPKAKIVTQLTSAYYEGLVDKDYTDEGLCIFMPKSEEAKEKVLSDISKIT